MRAVLILTTFIVAAAAVSVPSAMQCPDIADAHVATGWQEYRAGRIASAQSAFAAARARCPDHLESQLGLGYVALRNMEFDSAHALFARVLAVDPRHIDALVGHGLVAWRVEEYDSARAILERALALDPRRSDVRAHLAQLPPSMGPPPVRPALALPDSLYHHVRVNGDRFEVLQRGQWTRFYINGVNLGAALPGRFPSEFPDRGTYVTWLRDIAAMGANTVRTYTLHPPAFYDALAAHNAAHADRPLWLLQGVWAELPPGDDYYDAEWQADFFAEMERVIDVLHGRADVKRRAGHAAGYYTADVSRWTLGLILGREWEPYSVAEFNEKYPADTSWSGQYLAVSDATPMDVWLTKAMDRGVAYETRVYRTQRPIAYTNWPTLDPLVHPTELDNEEELTLRGVAYDTTRRSHNEDEVSLDGARVAALPAFAAGYFAAYHVYPYYPDFFLHDPDFNRASSPYGPSAYAGYLQALRSHYEGVPMVIAEYGVPASWGTSHFNPQGWHHGGHTEAEMAAVNARLTREIAAAGMAGGVLFAWIDEWFKHSWMTEPFETPRERNRMWWNRMNPEQHYGVLAVEPVRRLGETLTERRAAWDTVAPLYATADGTRIRAHADEAYLWLHLSGPATSAPLLMLGFDIIDPAGGGTRWPDAGALGSPVGIEFLLRIDSAGARLLATPRANPFRTQAVPRGVTVRDHATPVENVPPGFFTGSYTQIPNSPFTTPRREDARFDPMLAVINRARVGADSTNYLGMGYDRGVLREGALPDGAWERAGGAIELRIPWNLLNVTDPSSRHVAFDPPGTPPSATVGTTQVEAIRIVAAARARDGMWQTWPHDNRAADVASFSWPLWDEPQYRVRRRPAFDAMARVFAELAGAGMVSEQ